MKDLIKSSWFILMILLPLCTFAREQVIYTKLNVESMKMVKMLEGKGDEIYLTVTVFPSKGKAAHYRIPQFPMSWPSNTLDKIHNIKIWDSYIHPNESATIVIALIDQDVYPWNTDDLVGEIRLHIRNENNKLVGTWSIPNQDVTSVPLKIGSGIDFDLQGDEREHQYLVRLRLDTDTNNKNSTKNK